VQLGPDRTRRPAAEHGHGAAFSTTVSQHESAWAAELLDLAPPRPVVLDTGSGAGGLLATFAAAGAEVHGWERDTGLAAKATADGLPTTAPPDGEDVPRAAFDVVIANHTLSHEDDLDAAVATLARVLRPGGLLAVEFHHVLAVLTGAHFDIISHAHRSYLSLTVLTSVLRRHGLDVVTARTLPLHGGVVRLVARHGPAPADSSVDRILAQERAAGVTDPAAWAPVGAAADRARTDLRSVLADLHRQGRSVGGYGAPGRGTTLLNFCGLDRTVLPRTADRSAAKQGRFLPGTGTRICTPEELARDRPDVVLVLVWPLREEVIRQLDELRRAGTRFLLPLPAVELVE
jgi:SAM-dependent methyltransferase